MTQIAGEGRPSQVQKDYSPTTMYDDYPISPTLFHWQSSPHFPPGFVARSVRRGAQPIRPVCDEIHN